MPLLEGKTLVNRGFVTKPSLMFLKVVGTQESCCGLQTTDSAFAIAGTTHVCMSFYYQFCNNNNDINTINHSVLTYFHFESCLKPRKISHFDFTMDTVLLIFALINGPLIFISCLCTIIGTFNSLYHWCKGHFSKSCIKSIATQTPQSPRMLGFDISCHLEVINEVSLHFFFNFFFSHFHGYISTMALGFPKCNWISMNDALFTLKACPTALISF